MKLTIQSIRTIWVFPDEDITVIEHVHMDANHTFTFHDKEGNIKQVYMKEVENDKYPKWMTPYLQHIFKVQQTTQSYGDHIKAMYDINN